MAVFVSENEEKGIREKSSTANDNQTEGEDAAHNRGKLPAQSARHMATRKGGSKNIG
jgi:hypothetical protein